MAIDTIEKSIVFRLTGYDGLNALVGTRVFPGLLPQGTVKPAVYYDENKVERLSTDDGDGTYRSAEFAITVVADSYSSVKAVSTQVENALARWTQATPVEIIETLVSSDGVMPVEETSEWIAVTTVQIQYFVP